jgi:hypothetical protein
MRRSWYVLLLGIGLGVGCVDLPLFHDSPKPPAKDGLAKAARTPAPVTPESVTETNANEKAQALSEELDRDSENTTPLKGMQGKTIARP